MFIIYIYNTALAVTKALAAGPIIGQILAGIAAAAGAIQTGIIARQLSKLEDGGLLRGKPHSQGGMRIEGSNIEVEGDEFVVNRVSTRKNLGLNLHLLSNGSQTYILIQSCVVSFGSPIVLITEDSHVKIVIGTPIHFVVAHRNPVFDVHTYHRVNVTFVADFIQVDICSSFERIDIYAHNEAFVSRKVRKVSKRLYGTAAVFVDHKIVPVFPINSRYKISIEGFYLSYIAEFFVMLAIRKVIG